MQLLCACAAHFLIPGARVLQSPVSAGVERLELCLPNVEENVPIARTDPGGPSTSSEFLKTTGTEIPRNRGC